MARFSAPDDALTTRQGVTYRSLPTGELSTIEIPAGVGQVPLDLTGGLECTVVSTDGNVVANPIDGTFDVNVRRLRLQAKAAGSALVLAESYVQRWAFVHVVVYDKDPTRAAPQSPPQSGAPTAAGGGGTPDPVAELLGILEDRGFSIGDEEVTFLKGDTARNLLRVLLYSHRALASRKVQTQYAILVTAHTGAETLFGSGGPNAPIGNWFSVQLDDKLGRKAVKDALIARGVLMDSSARGNRASATADVTASSVDNPIFKTKMKDGSVDFNIPGMLEAQFDLVYGLPRDASDPSSTPDPIALYKEIGQHLKQKGISAKSLGAVIGRAYAGQGTAEGGAYSERLAGNYDHVIRALTWLVRKPPRGASDTAKAWARDLLGHVPPR
jgi:hypothetical protein